MTIYVIVVRQARVSKHLREELLPERHQHFFGQRPRPSFKQRAHLRGNLKDQSELHATMLLKITQCLVERMHVPTGLLQPSPLRLKLSVNQTNLNIDYNIDNFNGCTDCLDLAPSSLATVEHLEFGG